MGVLFLIPIQSETVLSYNTGTSSGCTVLCPNYLRKFIPLVFGLCLVTIQFCET